MVRQPLVGQDLLIIEVSRSHSDTPHSSRNPLKKCSAPRRDLNQTTHNTHNRQKSMTTAGFKPAIPGSERVQTHALDRAAIGIGTGVNTFTAIVDLSRFNNSCLKSPASNLVDLTFQSRALRSFSLNQLRNLSL